MSAELAEAQKTTARKWKPYPEYKPSGVEWLGEIPSHWELWKASHAFRNVSSGTTPETGSREFYDGDIPWVNTSELRESFIFDTAVKLTDIALRKHSALKLYKPGTVLIAMYGATIGRLGILGIEACTNQACCALSESDILDAKFTFYWLWASRTEIINLSYGGGQPNINQETIRSLRISTPPINEQHIITKFLDDETAKIDSLLAKREQLITLIEEKRKAIISHAVTKGLNPDAPMKDSGIDWIGETPAHWEVTRTKFVAQQLTGHTPSRKVPEYWLDCTIPWFTLADVWQIRDGEREYIETTEECISELGLANSSARLLPAGTVIVSRTASVGFSGITALPMATTQDFANWVCGPRIRPEYLLYVFRAMEQEFRRLVMGSTHQTIYMPDIGRFVTPVPPRNEQDQIVDYIRSATARVNGIKDKLRKQIAKLHERRTALISAAVTGKIDVRGEAG